MLFVYHGNDTRRMKDAVFALKKRAPLVDEFEAAETSWQQIEAACRATTLFDKPHLIIVANAASAPADLQKKFSENASFFARVPHAVLFYDPSDLGKHELVKAAQAHGNVKRFDMSFQTVHRSANLSPLLFQCADAWAEGNNGRALALAAGALKRGITSDQLLWALESKIKTLLMVQDLPAGTGDDALKLHPFVLKKAHSQIATRSGAQLRTQMRALRDMYHASRLTNKDLAHSLASFLCR